MAAAASPAFLLFLELLLLLLQSGWSGARRADAHSLWYSFTIIHLPRPGQRWCEVQGQVDQKHFLSYDCGTDKVFSVGRLEEQLNATDAWERQLEMLREVGQTLRLELPGIELEDFTPSGPVTLQARMSCECEADGHIHGSWEFGFHGQKFLLFDSNSRKWTVVHAGARQMKEKWEEDGELTQHLEKLSVGDCGSWLQDFLMCREKRLEPTAPPTVSSGMTQPISVATTLSPWGLLILLSFVLYVIYISSESEMVVRLQTKETDAVGGKADLFSRCGKQLRDFCKNGSYSLTTHNGLCCACSSEENRQNPCSSVDSRPAGHTAKEQQPYGKRQTMSSPSLSGTSLQRHLCRNCCEEGGLPSQFRHVGLIRKSSISHRMEATRGPRRTPVLPSPSHTALPAGCQLLVPGQSFSRPQIGT
ncbi:UL16-binding protein 3 [Saimiri boliviensis]|uniref:UL16-binding protein 3 n=1 Tax=Saimiri boliviensis TaxID=27679 RepID=UPI003D77E596